MQMILLGIIGLLTVLLAGAVFTIMQRKPAATCPTTAVAPGDCSATTEQLALELEDANATNATLEEEIKNLNTELETVTQEMNDLFDTGLSGAAFSIQRAFRNVTTGRSSIVDADGKELDSGDESAKYAADDEKTMTQKIAEKTATHFREQAAEMEVKAVKTMTEARKVDDELKKKIAVEIERNDMKEGGTRTPPKDVEDIRKSVMDMAGGIVKPTDVIERVVAKHGGKSVEVIEKVKKVIAEKGDGGAELKKLVEEKRKKMKEAVRRPIEEKKLKREAAKKEREAKKEARKQKMKKIREMIQNKMKSGKEAKETLKSLVSVMKAKCDSSITSDDVPQLKELLTSCLNKAPEVRADELAESQEELMETFGADVIFPSSLSG